jgi:hypothetical protein
MKILPLPSMGELNDLLHYNAETGQFTWKKWRGFKARANTPAGALSASGYVLMCINGKRYLAHRIAYKMVYGFDPQGILDHIDGNIANNCISNLRVANSVENQGNSRRPKHNTSGVKGVHWHRRDKQWVAQIKKGCSKIWLGGFSTKEEAAAAYEAAAKEHFGDFANIGEGL